MVNMQERREKLFYNFSLIFFFVVVWRMSDKQRWEHICRMPFMVVQPMMVFIMNNMNVIMLQNAFYNFEFTLRHVFGLCAFNCQHYTDLHWFHNYRFSFHLLLPRTASHLFAKFQIRRQIAKTKQRKKKEKNIQHTMDFSCRAHYPLPVSSLKTDLTIVLTFETNLFCLFFFPFSASIVSMLKATTEKKKRVRDTTEG